MRVMRVLTRPNLGGPTRQAIALWHAHAAAGVATLLVTGRVAAGESMLSPADGGVPRVTFADLEMRGPDCAGWLEVEALGRGIAPLADHRAGKVLAAIAARHRPDVVHTHTSKAGWLGRRAAFAARVPVVAHTFHGHVLQDYFAPPFVWWLRRLERRLAARTDLLFAVSASCADELAEARIAPRERFLVVPPAVALPEPLPRAEARERLGIAPHEVRAVCVGRLVPVKRVQDFVAAVACSEGVAGDVFGDGALRAQLEANVPPAGQGRVHFRGAHPGIAALLPAYDVLVVPSVREGCPLVAVEAFAAGVPVVGYDVPGVTDVLAGGAGLLVPPHEGPEGLARAMRTVLADPARRAGLMARAHDRAGAFAPAAVAERLARAYHEASPA